MSGGPAGISGPTNCRHDEAWDGPGDHDAPDPRVQLASAVLYVIGIALCGVGCMAAFLWAPLLWCAAAGLVLIAVSFIVSGGRL